MERMLAADALLFDLDGTIVDSSGIFDQLWTDWGNRNGIDPARILAVHHGRRIPETIALTAPPGFDIARGEQEVLEMASAATDGLKLVSGVREVLMSLPRARWAIVTSSYRDLTLRWLKHFGLPEPGALVTGPDVAPRGKPLPDCYLLGASKLGVDPRRCVVFEDAPAGIAAGEAAGAEVIVVATSLKGEALGGRRWMMDFTELQVVSEATGLLVHWQSANRS
jgi:mannitol-1-/sugar-/sorbitol-6-phosphatase